jgi:hypothetical protein
MADPLILADLDLDEFLTDEIIADDQYERYLAEQESADRLAAWEAALRARTFAPQNTSLCQVARRVAHPLRRPRERRARSCVSRSAGGGDPPEPDLVFSHQALPWLTRGEFDFCDLGPECVCRAWDERRPT